MPRRPSREPTRRLPLEELAELQLEQGFVERALRIYEALASDPDNALAYAARIRTLRSLLPPPAQASTVRQIRTLVVR
ncbi:MAG: hypothetical protein K8H88_27720 [Sandaracinaceae bacterium]|nr:hypothetical protein [Sandaracinaceae bacterium]